MVKCERKNENNGGKGKVSSKSDCFSVVVDFTEIIINKTFD